MELSINLTIPDNEEDYIKALLKTKGLIVAAFIDEYSPIALTYKVTDIRKVDDAIALPSDDGGVCGHSFKGMRLDDLVYNHKTIDGVLYIDSYHSVGCKICDKVNEDRIERRVEEYKKEHDVKPSNTFVIDASAEPELLKKEII